jgi:hypothetical protein
MKTAQSIHEQIYQEEFQRGFKEVERLVSHLAELRFCPDTENIERVDKKIKKRHWFQLPNPTLNIRGEKGVPLSKLEEAKRGIQRFILNPYALDMDIIVNENCETATNLLKDIYKSPIPDDTTALTMLGNMFRYGSTEYGPDRTSQLPVAGNLIVTDRALGDGWGGTEQMKGVAAVYTIASNLEVISAHEFMHYTGLDGQKHTKWGYSMFENEHLYDNCKNDCLMNFSLREDGVLCEPCDTGINGFLDGRKQALEQYGTEIES